MQRRDALRAMVASLAGAIALPFLPKMDTLPPHFDPAGGRYFGMHSFTPSTFSVPIPGVDVNVRQWRDAELRAVSRWR